MGNESNARTKQAERKDGFMIGLLLTILIG
jgi:hypothetical protein